MFVSNLVHVELGVTIKPIGGQFRVELARSSRKIELNLSSTLQPTSSTSYHGALPNESERDFAKTVAHDSE